MNSAKVIAYVTAGLLALGIATLPPQARADEWNQKTVMTFSGPVEIPGQVLLPGTYVFKLMDSQSDRNIVEVFNKRENHLYGIFLAIPDYRLKLPGNGKPIITFEERAAGAPEAVKAWFYPATTTVTSSFTRRSRPWRWLRRAIKRYPPCRTNWRRIQNSPRRA